MIAVNTRFLLKDKLEGIGRFTAETLSRITRNHPECDFLFLFDRPYDDSFIFSDNITPIVIHPPARHPFLWYAWFEWGVARTLKKHQPDVFLSTDGYCSLRTDVPTVLVVHDISFEHFPEQVPYLVRHYYQHYTPLFCAHAERIVTVSDYTRKDVQNVYGIDQSKITVAYNGVNEIFQPMTEDKAQEVQQKHAEGHPYFLFVGAIHPRKNLANTLLAYDAFRKRTDQDMRFVVAGRKAWQSEAAFQVYQEMEFQKEVLFLGHLPLEELASLYAAAEALCYISFFEGFGIPIIEAMRSDTAVITADVSSMPEVAGSAALLCSPDDVEQISSAMWRIRYEKGLKEDLIVKGRLQQSKFNWDLTAERLWEQLSPWVH